MTRLALRVAAALPALALLATSAMAQTDTVGKKLAYTVQKTQATPPEQSFERFLFQPELVMQHQQKIGLRTDQRTAIRKAILELQTKVLELQWTLQDHQEKLTGLLERPAVNENEVLGQVDQVLATEREVKRAQMAMLIRVKNTLTAQQQAALRQLRCTTTESGSARVTTCW